MCHVASLDRSSYTHTITSYSFRGGGRRESCLATGCHDNGHHLFDFSADAAFINTFLSLSPVSAIF